MSRIARFDILFICFAMFFIFSNYAFALNWEIQTVEPNITLSNHTSVDIAVDSNGTGYIAYYSEPLENSGLSLYVAYTNNDTWAKLPADPNTFLSTITSYNPKACIAIDVNDHIHVVYPNNDSHLVLRTYDGSSWSGLKTIDNAGICEPYDIKTDSNSNLGIVYRRAPIDKDYSKSKIIYASYNSGNLEKNIVAQSNSFVSGSLAIDINGSAHIAYLNEVNETLIYSMCDDGNCSNETIDTVGNLDELEWGATSIAIDNNDTVHISYCDLNNFDIKHAYKTSLTFNIETVEPVGATYQWNSLVIDSCDFLHICYKRHLPAEKNLTHSYLSSSGWDSDNVDDINASGAIISLAIDAFDNLHVAYIDHELQTIQYAKATLCGDENHPSQTADIDENCVVDMRDMATFSSHWFDTGCSEPNDCGGADLDGKGSVDINDLGILSEQWLDCSILDCMP